MLYVGIDEISEEGVDHSDSDESDKSDSSDSEYVSEDEQELKNAPKTEDQEDAVFKNKKRTRPASSQPQNNKNQSQNVTEKGTSEPLLKRKASGVSEKEAQEKLRSNQQTPKAGHEAKSGAAEADSDSERELVIDLGEEQGGKERKKPKRETSVTNSVSKDNTTVKTEGAVSFLSVTQV